MSGVQPTYTTKEGCRCGASGEWTAHVSTWPEAEARKWRELHAPHQPPVITQDAESPRVEYVHICHRGDVDA